jgi:hypothetical protein
MSQVDVAEAGDDTLSELSVPLCRGGGDRMLRSSSVITDRSVKRQGLAGPMPGQESIPVANLNLFHLIETLRELLRFSASPFAFADSLKLLLAPLHLKDTPDVAPSWSLLFNFAVLNLRHLNEPPRIRKIGR